ncbi:Cof-type HAD-IIB family hydrolase [Faecalicatena contorta]|uniref:Cof-type HAD-IIB family hydrolase n=1 Tax=Faecalicatena fissicatena TaxID=290055 RepID=A0ABS2EAJ9_9FIRM|nr:MULTISPECIES: HAD family hydrolase [Clostridia]HIX98195.1 Cof-type HAD-IIB family hydrolase [Candidatus Dorea intestinigallinarum]HJA44180.1 Cof-type HAD-IIB family hydrolase [Candidatus Dorea stercoravium]MBM6686043.1 Cof-type HAD-IIB family hydrolase [Faecalicatena contorta]MBM6710689.1 Cof-type HAD-IIB family hydrolase [Faecalicatena contorta]MBM6738678.1 Cof-type HAD-IIB family hydrolase [Faecalicatena fissicatena]
MKITSIALDLDGTTLNSRGILSERTRRAIAEALERGICVIPASGRSFDSLPEEILSISGIRYAITSNGTAVVEVHTGEYLRKFSLTEESVEKILWLMDGRDVVFEAFIDGKPYAQKEYVEDPVRYGAMPAAIGYIQRTREPVAGMEAFIRAHAAEGKLDCLDVVVKGEEKKRSLWCLLEREVTDIYVTSSVPQLLEISYRDAGKESALKFLLRYLGLEQTESAAFGDGDNDRGMLAFAGIGIAVSNGSQGCLQAADYIAGSNDEDGVARFIEWLLAMQKEEQL